MIQKINQRRFSKILYKLQIKNNFLFIGLIQIIKKLNFYVVVKKMRQDVNMENTQRNYIRNPMLIFFSNGRTNILM